MIKKLILFFINAVKPYSKHFIFICSIVYVYMTVSLCRVVVNKLLQFLFWHRICRQVLCNLPERFGIGVEENPLRAIRLHDIFQKIEGLNACDEVTAEMSAACIKVIDGEFQLFPTKRVSKIINHEEALKLTWLIWVEA
jgi:hypothetical protein